MYELLVILFLIKLYARINVYLMDFTHGLRYCQSLRLSMYLSTLNFCKLTNTTHTHINTYHLISSKTLSHKLHTKDFNLKYLAT